MPDCCDCKHWSKPLLEVPCCNCYWPEKTEFEPIEKADETVSLWTVYDHPLDYPDKFVARKFILDVPTDEIVTADTLEELREKLPKGLYCIPRQPGDDPNIVEVWL